MTENSDQLVHLDDPASQNGVEAAAAGKGRQLFGLDSEALAAHMVGAGEPAWRGNQLAEAMYCQHLTELSEITTLPKALRERLTADCWEVGRPRIVQVYQSADGTERYLVQGQGSDGLTVETVWMPEGDDGESGDGSDPDKTNEATDRRQRATISSPPRPTARSTRSMVASAACS